MRVLHTSDWHVGKTLRGRSRAAEHEAVFAEMAALADRESVDLVLVVGDLFDTAAPTPESERIVYRALLDLARGGRPVVVVAGNHDNPVRLGAVRPLLDLGHVHVQPALAPPDHGGVLDLDVGGERARIALLPFVSQRHIVDADDLMRLDAHEHSGRYAERVKRVIAALTAGFGTDTVNLVAGHLLLTGGTLGGGERAAHTIFDYAVSATAFPAGVHYGALGHLHRSQRIEGPCPLWYCGSPLQLDFGETADAKAVNVIDARPGMPAEVRVVPLSSGRRLRTIEGTLAELEPLAGTTGDDFLRIVVREQPRPGLADDVRAMFADAVDVAVARQDDAERAAPTARLGRSPRELFAEYLTEQSASDDSLLALFDELLEVAGEEGVDAA
jgi:exonuclease SbcD